MSAPIVGDAIPAARKIEEVVRSGIPLAIVPKASLADEENPLNDRTISGKQEGAAFIATSGTAPVVYEIAIATGSLKTDAWTYIGAGGSNTNPQIQDVGTLASGDDPTSASWGAPPAGTMIQTAYVSQSFSNAPPVSGSYVGTLSKMLSFDADNGQRIEYFTADGEHWTRTKLAGGWDAWIHANAHKQDIIDAGAVTSSVDPSLDTWGNPNSDTSMVNGDVTGEFIGAPANIDAGTYAGTITKIITSSTVRLTYVTKLGREYQKIKNTAGWGSWEETGVAAKEGIWAVKQNATTTTTTASLTTYVTAAIDISKFNAVEQDFLGALTINTDNEFKFVAGHDGAYEVQIHGMITEASTGTSSVLTIRLHDGTEVLTGSTQILAPVGEWGGTRHYTFNCNGFARLDPNTTVTVQISSDAAGTFTVGDCIVVLKPLD